MCVKKIGFVKKALDKLIVPHYNVSKLIVSKLTLFLIMACIPPFGEILRKTGFSLNDNGYACKEDYGKTY